MAQEQGMEKAFKGKEQLKAGMERSAVDMTQTAKEIERVLQKTLERARTRTPTRERER